MTSRAVRSQDMRRRITNDVDKMLMEYGVSPLSLFSAEQYENLLTELVDVAMYHVDCLLHEATT